MNCSHASTGLARGATIRRVKFWILALVLMCAGCASQPTSRPVAPHEFKVSPKRPQDMTDRILMDTRFPDWLKRNYAEWIRYGYDRELRNR
jgi:hypothetical protein